MGGWGCDGLMRSKGFEYIQEPEYPPYDEYPLVVPEVFLEGIDIGSTQNWGDCYVDTIVEKRPKEMVKYERTIRYKRWIKVDGQEILIDDEDYPNGAEVEILDKPLEHKNEIRIVVYDLEKHTKTIYETICKKANVPFGPDEIKRFQSETNSSIEAKVEETNALDQSLDILDDDGPF